MNGWVVEIEKLRAENDRLQAEANRNMEELCKLRGTLEEILQDEHCSHEMYMKARAALYGRRK